MKKLLKYDCKDLFKYWWIVATITFILSILGGLCLKINNYDKELPAIVYVMSAVIMALVVFSFAVFALLTVIITFARFYRNFFTDEGYLTFTLPVKKSQLLASKLISSTFITILTALVCIVNGFTIFYIAEGSDFIEELVQFIEELVKHLGIYTWVYLLEGILILIAAAVFSYLLMFCCITFGSIITKKAKVLASIGIYYGVYNILFVIFEIFILFGAETISRWMYDFSMQATKGVVALILFGILLFISLFCSLLYTLQYWMIDRKLNLN